MCSFFKQRSSTTSGFSCVAREFGKRGSRGVLCLAPPVWRPVESNGAGLKRVRSDACYVIRLADESGQGGR